MLKRILDSILQYTSNIIVVNDGSTDETVQIHLSENFKKGMALRAGFEKALTKEITTLPQKRIIEKYLKKIKRKLQ